MIEYGQAPTGRQDLSAAFRVGYSADRQRLFIAVEVEDQSVIVDSTSNVFWNTNDGCELYVDIGHAAADLPEQHYVYGTRVSASLQEAASTAHVSWQRGEGFHRYEWSVDLGPVRDRSIGIDVVVTDKDGDGSFSWMTWGEGVAKIIDGERLGDVVITNGGDSIGELAWSGVTGGGHTARGWTSGPDPGRRSCRPDGRRCDRWIAETISPGVQEREGVVSCAGLVRGQATGCAPQVIEPQDAGESDDQGHEKDVLRHYF